MDFLKDIKFSGKEIKMTNSIQILDNLDSWNTTD